VTLSTAEKKRRCIGCRANRYNMGRGYQESGVDAPVTVDQCWHLKSARAANKKVYYSPSDINLTLRKGTLTCWHNNFGYGSEA
jgi:hypothetical protein